MNISRIAAKLAQLEGTSAKIKLGEKQIKKLAENSKPGITEALQKALNKYPNAQAEVAYKVSQQGFAVGAVEIKNGKEVLGRGAASITGFGTETPIAKMRVNLGKNGDVYSQCSYLDLGKTPKLEDIESALSMKKGIITAESKLGDFASGYQRLDAKKLLEFFGVEKAGSEIIEEGNNFIKKIVKELRKTVSGKKATPADLNLHLKNVPKDLKNLKFKDSKDIEKMIKDLKTHTDFNSLDYKKVPINLELAGEAGTGKQSVSSVLNRCLHADVKPLNKEAIKQFNETMKKAQEDLKTIEFKKPTDLEILESPVKKNFLKGLEDI